MSAEGRISTQDDRSLSKESTAAAIPVASRSAISDVISDLSPPAPASQDFHPGLPFADFVGRCFLRLCLWGEILASLGRAKRPGAEKIRSATSNIPGRVGPDSERQDWPRPGWLRSFIGAACCTLAAASLVLVFSTSPYRPMVPFILLIVISYIAVRFGDLAGVAGTLCAALVFAAILFPPPGIAISNPGERSHLISMVILGVCASELLGRRKSSKACRLRVKPAWFRSKDGRSAGVFRLRGRI